MCGFAGILDIGNRDVAKSVLVRMADAIAHRGPDDSGIWMDKSHGVGLAHRRLSILDLSPGGHQPMVSASGRFVIAFNGEIYNHLDLRRDLESSGQAPDWRGHSDTETLLAAFDAWGMEATLKNTVGMFALALWDRATRTLTLARDRLGEKPLYYGWQNNVFLFGSELKALRAHPTFSAEINRDALTLLLRHNYIPVPYTIYLGIHKLPPGCFLQMDITQALATKAGEAGKLRCYWSAREAAEQGQANPFTGTEVEACNELERLLGQSIAGQMISDVPLGAFLSGGVDSSTVVALMQAQSARPVKTFTIGFHEDAYNEAEHAHAVARHLGCEHTELYVKPEEALAVIPLLPTIYDEPFSDSSQIPTYLVSRLAREQVTVSLSGDGGDELFGGYNRYFWAPEIWRKLSWAPRNVRAAFAVILTAIPPAMWNRIFDGGSRLLPAKYRYANPGDKLHKLAEIVAARTSEEIYHGLVSHWKEPAAIVPGAGEPPTVLTGRERCAQLTDYEHRMMYLDTVSYLPDDILVKVDRAAMAVSLETRVPMLDHRVVEFAWQLPLSMKIHDGQGKHLLRQVLYKYVPKELIERPKTGFGVPIDHWLRGPLREWAEHLLDEGRLAREGLFDPVPVREKWQEHLSGQRNWQYWLWDILMFQAWYENHGVR